MIFNLLNFLFLFLGGTNFIFKNEHCSYHVFPSVAWPVHSTTDPLPPLLWAEMSRVELSSCPITHKSGENPTQRRVTPLFPILGIQHGHSLWILSLWLLFLPTSLRGEHLLKAIKITQCPDFNLPVTMLNIFHLKKINF